MPRMMIVMCMVALAAARVSAAENLIFLDFNHDNDLETIEDVSSALTDTVTLIFEFNAGFPIEQFVISYETNCRVVEERYGYPHYSITAYMHWFDELGYNENLLEYGIWTMHVCYYNCSCYQHGLLTKFVRVPIMHPGRRYELTKFIVERGADWGEGRLRATFGDPFELVSNDVVIGDGVDPVVTESWGRIKGRYRDGR